MATIVLGGKQFEIDDEFDFKTLRVVLPAFFRCHEKLAQGSLNDSVFDDFAIVIAAAIQTKTPDFPITQVWDFKLKGGFMGMLEPLNIIAKSAGLELKQGEKAPVAPPAAEAVK